MTNHGSSHRFSPREQKSLSESPSPSHRRSASSSATPWDGEYYAQDEMIVNDSSPRSVSVKHQTASQYSHSRNHTWTTKNTSRGKLMVMSDRHRQPPEQLANSKQQWNTQRDIPSGTVRNNPFVPKRDPSPPTSPQLLHQKNHWDTADIPRGSVSSKTFLMNHAEEMLGEGRSLSPRRTQHFQQGRSYGSSGRDDTEVRLYHSSPRISAPISPGNRTMTHQTSTGIDQLRLQSSLSGRFDSMRPSPTTNTGSPWNQVHDEEVVQEGTERQKHSQISSPVAVDLSRDDNVTAYVSSGMARDFERNRTVRGRISSPFHQQNTSPRNRASARFTSWKPSREIPKGTVKGRVATLFGGTNTLNGDSRQVPKHTRQITVADMDEDPWIIPSKPTAGVSVSNWGQALQAKSDDSEEWDNPNTDWLQQPNKEINPPVRSSLNKSRQESSSFDGEKDVIKTAVRKEKLFDAFGEPLNPVNDRDMDILMAAKSKNHGSSHIVDVSGHDHRGFSTTLADEEFERRAFPDDDAFGSSFVDFQEPQKLPSQPISGFHEGFRKDDLEDTFYDAGLTTTQYDSPKEVETLHSIGTDATSTTQSGELEPKKERRSIFNIFGGGRKDKGTKTSKSKLSFVSTNMGQKTPSNSANDYRSTSPTLQTTSCEVPVRQKHSSGQHDYAMKSVIVTNLSRGNRSTAVGQRSSSIQPGMEPLNYKRNGSALDSNFAKDDQKIEREETWLGSLPPSPQTKARNEAKLAVSYVQKKSYEISHDVKVTEGVMIHSTENSNVQGDHLDRIFQDGAPPSQKNSLRVRKPELAAPRSHSPEPIDTTAGGENLNMKLSVIVQPYSEFDDARMNERECADPNLSHLAVGGSEDSDSDGSRKLLNQLETKRHSRILRSGPDRKRKTEKLRKYGEVNSRFKEHRSQGTGDPKPDLSYPRTLKNSRYTKEVQDRNVHYEAKQTNGSRHAKIKYNITGSKLAKRNESEDALSTKTKRSKARTYARQRAGFVIDDVMHSNSSESAESVTLASVGSDIRVLRSILRRPRRSISVTSQSRGKFPTFEETKLDPMQQSGLKMLSATIIPMQAQVRRFLAMRRALTRMWALIVIQAHTRRWITEKRYRNTLQSAITIQAVVRGHLARDDLDFKHVCAIEIQRVIRGYMSTMKVYEDIYKITVIQSYVRMKQAMDKASWKMAHIVQLQSVFRGFLVRRRQEYQQICAVAIQANWRRFYHRLNYQFDLLDIIIVQSVWRKKIAERKLEDIRRGRLDKAAAVIQSKWRQVLYTAVYIQDRAHILVTQSALRRYLARKRARLIRDYWVIPAQAYARGYLGRRALEKHRAARKIQSTWRGFVGYADFMFSIADIVTVQKTARAWLARRAANNTRKLNMAATTIQSACRVILSKGLVSRVPEVREMERSSLELAEKEALAATSIQNAVRRMQTRSAYIAFMAARKVQTFWRCRNLTNAYKYYRAAMAIQSNFRGMKARQETLILRGEILAATIIQSAWRGFVSYTDYIFSVSDIITVQRAFRGHLARKTKDGAIVHKAIQQRRKTIAAATAIQKGCRGLLDRQRYWYTLGCTMQIQSWMRGRLVVLQLRREEKARVKLQSFARRFLARQEYVQKKFIFVLIQTAEQERSKKIEALIIQEKARNDIDEKRKHNAACTIQRFFISVREEVDQLVRAARRRKNWKKKNSKKEREENGSDELLEDAWLDVASDSNLENDSFLAQANAKNGSDLESKSSKERFSVEDSRSVGQCNNENQKVLGTGNRAVKRNLLPPSKSTASPALNEFSKLTGSETAFYRMPPARTKRMDSREMSDDLELEEAFMDAKIINAKHRRIANKKRNYRV